MLICGLYFPLIYGNGFNIIDRYVNIVQISMWILGVVNTYYWLGWAKKLVIKQNAATICVIAVLAIATTAEIDFSAEPGGRGSFTVVAPFSAVIIYEFFTGEIQAYHTAYRNLLNFMESDETYPPYFRNLPELVPSVFVRPFSNNDDDDFTIEWFASHMSRRFGRELPIP